MRGKGKQQLRAVVRDKRTNELVAQHCAPHWCYAFHLRLRTMLLSTPAYNSPHHATRVAIDQLLGSGAIADVVVVVEQVLQMLQEDSVKQFVLMHTILEGKRVPEEDYLM